MKFVNQTVELFDFAMGWPLPEYVKTQGESKHQKKIISFLENEGFEVIKIVVANKAGNSDIIACSPVGQFWKIEAKHEEYKLEPLQFAKLKKFWRKKAVCIAAYGFEDFKLKYKVLLTSSRA